MNDESFVQNSAEPQSGKASARPISAVLFDYVEMFAWSVFAVLVLFTFFFRLCRVDGQSMENTLYDQESLILWNAGYTPAQEDIVVFHLTNKSAGLEKTLVKRVIAVGGQTVSIHIETGEILVDGERFDDSHATLKDRLTEEITNEYVASLFQYGVEDGIFEVTVPEGQLFVMGDNRNNSRDSRDVGVGFVDARCVLGKVILRIHPFTSFI